MGLIMHSIFIVIFVLSSFIGLSKCELEAIVTDSRLPVPMCHIRSIYDGHDSIYLFGGFDLTHGNRIHRFQISSDTLSPPITSFPSVRYAGAISSDSSGNIFYYGGPFRTVTKFDPNNLNSSNVATLEADFALGTAVVHHNSPDIAYVIGGGRNTVQCFNMSSVSSCGRFKIPSSFNYISAFVHRNKAFVFGRFTSGDILVLDLQSLQFQSVPTALPDFLFEPSVVTDGRYAYLLGGQRNSSQALINSLVRFDPETLEVELIHVKNHPGLDSAQYFHFTSTLFVEKLNRIFVFGGLSRLTNSNDHLHDEIWYIDLPNSVPTITTMQTTTVPTATIFTTTKPTPITTSTEATVTDPTSGIPTTTELNPDIFNCDGKPNGMYPNPSNCASYIGCYEGVMSLYDCPLPLLFHHERERCDFPQEVDCPISCLGMPNGLYPHPHQCHLFIGCLGGSLRVHKCPDELLFDPQLLMCWYPQEVECLVE